MPVPGFLFRHRGYGKLGLAGALLIVEGLGDVLWLELDPEVGDARRRVVLAGAGGARVVVAPVRQVVVVAVRQVRVRHVEGLRVEGVARRLLSPAGRRAVAGPIKVLFLYNKIKLFFFSFFEAI